MNEKKQIIAVIDDVYEDAEILRRCLQTIPDLEFEVVHFFDANEAFESLQRIDVDLIFLDYLLGETSGIDLLRKLRLSGDIRPIIIYTGQANQYIVAEMMRSGADDYLDKNDLHAAIIQRSMAIAAAQYVERLNMQDNSESQTFVQQPILVSAIQQNQQHEA